MSEVITLYRVFLKIFNLRKVQHTIILTSKVGELACGPSACFLPVHLRVKSKNVQGLVFTLNRDKLMLLALKWKGKNTIQSLGGLRMEPGSMRTESTELSGEEGFLSTTAAKT